MGSDASTKETISGQEEIRVGEEYEGFDEYDGI